MEILFFFSLTEVYLTLEILSEVFNSSQEVRIPGLRLTGFKLSFLVDYLEIGLLVFEVKTPPTAWLSP